MEHSISCANNDEVTQFVVLRTESLTMWNTIVATAVEKMLACQPASQIISSTADVKFLGEYIDILNTTRGKYKIQFSTWFGVFLIVCCCRFYFSFHVLSYTCLCHRFVCFPSQLNRTLYFFFLILFWYF